MDFLATPLIGNDFLTFNQGSAPTGAPDDIDLFLGASFADSHLYNSTGLLPSSSNLNPEALTISSLQHAGAEWFWFPTWVDGNNSSREALSYSTSTEISTAGSEMSQSDLLALPASSLRTYSTCPSTSYSTDSSPSQLWDGAEELYGFAQGPVPRPRTEQQLSTAPASSTSSRIVKKKRRKGPVTCSLCNSQFERAILLRAHMREHNGQYQCEKCGQTFAERCNLVVHRKAHASHTCGTCGRLFAKATCYRKHLKCHLPDRPRLKCTQKGCDKEYSVRGGLNRHLKSQHGKDASFVCGACGRGFGRLDQKDRHEDRHCKVTRARRAVDDAARAALVSVLPQQQPTQQPMPRMQAPESTSIVQPPKGGEINPLPLDGADHARIPLFPPSRPMPGEPMDTNDDEMAFGHVFQQPLVLLNEQLNAPSTDLATDFMNGGFFQVYDPMTMAADIDASTHLGFGGQY